MYTEPRRSAIRTACILVFAAIFFSASQVFAHHELDSLESQRVDENNVTVEWEDSQGTGYYDVFYVTSKGRERYVGFTRDNKFTIRGLAYDTDYEIRVVALDGRDRRITIRTENRRQDQENSGRPLKNSARGSPVLRYRMR